jgi:DNA-binding IclR family transcriptional regulator
MIKRGSLLLDFRGLLELASETGLKKSELIDCTTVLDDAGLWDAQPAHGKIPFAYVTGVTFGLERYCRAFVPNYSEVCDQLCRLLVDGVGSSQEVAERLGQPRVLIEHVFQVLEQNDYVSTGGTREYILDVKPKLRRLFSNGENQD